MAVRDSKKESLSLKSFKIITEKAVVYVFHRRYFFSLLLRSEPRIPVKNRFFCDLKPLDHCTGLVLVWFWVWMFWLVVDCFSCFERCQ